MVLSPQPCIYRARALAALDRAKKPWHISYTSPSLAGTIAAVKAGLGITVLPANMLPPGIHPIRKGIKLPELADAEIALMKRDNLSKASEMLAEHIALRFHHLIFGLFDFITHDRPPCGSANDYYASYQPPYHWFPHSVSSS